MNDIDITPREFDLLKVIARATSANRENRVPDNNWLAKQLNVTSSGISNLKRSLKEKGFLAGNSRATSLTEEALSLLSKSQFVFPTQIPVLGKVKAGRVRQDDIIVEINNIDQLSDFLTETITIPQVGDTSEVFALRVVGQSMEDENVFDGDYVIVQRFKDNEAPKQGEMIVTQYLHIDDEEYVDTEYLNSSGQLPDEYLEGPTVKYFYRQNEKIRLSHRKNTHTSSYTIETRFHRPVGRVVGIYRSIN
jgi:SOS-response transcriptional repressor LexA